MRHIAYGDERGSPGSIVTFFDMPGVVRGRPGVGMVHRLLSRLAGVDAVGESLLLVGDLEGRRKELERRFPLLSNPRASG